MFLFLLVTLALQAKAAPQIKGLAVQDARASLQQYAEPFKAVCNLQANCSSEFMATKQADFDDLRKRVQVAAAEALEIVTAANTELIAKSWARCAELLSDARSPSTRDAEVQANLDKCLSSVVAPAAYLKDVTAAESLTEPNSKLDIVKNATVTLQSNFAALAASTPFEATHAQVALYEMLTKPHDVVKSIANYATLQEACILRCRDMVEHGLLVALSSVRGMVWPVVEHLANRDASAIDLVDLGSGMDLSRSVNTTALHTANQRCIALLGSVPAWLIDQVVTFSLSDDESAKTLSAPAWLLCLAPRLFEQAVCATMLQKKKDTLLQPGADHLDMESLVEDLSAYKDLLCKVQAECAKFDLASIGDEFAMCVVSLNQQLADVRAAILKASLSL